MKSTGAARLGLWLVLPGLALWPVFCGQTQFFYRDVTRQYAPLQAQLDAAWSAGEAPLWNASTQSGVPLLANLHAGVLAPWTPLFRWLPFHRAYGVVVALAWAAWMAGLYRFLRGRLGRAPSALGALTGGVAGAVLGATSYLPFLAGLACVPWQLLALRQRSRLARVSLLATLFTLQVLMGDPSTALMGGLACLVVAWLEAPDAAESCASLAWAGVAAVGASAVQLLPAWTLYQESARAQASLDARLAWSFHPARALEFVVRRPWGALLEPPYFTRWDLAAGPDAQPFLLEHGWGLLAVLMLGAALSTRGPLRRVGVGLVVLGFTLSLGRHLGPLQQVFDGPPLSLFRFPERYGVLTTLGAALLTAHGAGALLDQAKLRTRWAVGWAMLAVVLAGAALADGPLRPALLTTATLLGVASVAALLLSRVWWAWLLALVTLGAVDAVQAVRASVLTLPAEPLPAVAALPAGHRVWRENGPLRTLEQPVRGAEAFAAERRLLHQTFASATPGMHGVEELGGYSPVSLRRWQRVIQATTPRPELLSSLFDVCAVVSTRARGANPGWKPLATLAEETVLYELDTCRGRAWSVTEVLDVRDTEDAVGRMLAPGFEPSTTATREGGEALPLLGKAAVALAPRARASELELTVEPGAQWALLVVSETWAPGWRAWVDERERPVELLDGTLLGVAVPPGGKRVVLRYEEPLGITGLAVSVATVLLLGLWWARRWRAGVDS